MERFGIDVSRFKRRGLLHILRIRDPAKHPKGLQAGIDQIIEKFMSTGVASPYRIATGRNSFVRDLNTPEGFNAELQIVKCGRWLSEGVLRVSDGWAKCWCSAHISWEKSILTDA